MKKFNSIIDNIEIISKDYDLIKNPATFEPIGEVGIATESDVDQAIQAAKKAQKSWASLSDDKRKAYLQKVATVLTDNKEYLAEWITKEQGKPLAGPNALFEMEACIGWTQVPASLDLPVETVFEDDTRKDVLYRKPIGVVAAIAPWNWPLMIAIWQIIPSLRAGNTVVIKPSEYTSICSVEMVRIINEVLPAGVLNIITGHGALGAYLVSHPDVNKIMFTGSIATGKKIVASSVNNLARITLECGGNDPGIILPETDISKIAQDLFWGAFLNMGQTCACLKRLYVHEDDKDAVVTALKAVNEQIKMGNGLDQNNLLGPIQNEMQYKKVVGFVNDAIAKGGKIEVGGKPFEGEGYFYPITLVTNIDHGVALVDEEQFGPVLPIITYKNIEEAIEKANAFEVGLGSSVWANDVNQAQEVAARIIAGTTWINQHGAIHPFVPFGGVKQSGYGVEFGNEGLKAVTVPHIISIKK